MSGSRPSVGIRISAEGAEQARRQIEAIGPAGEAAMRRVAVASAAAAPEMQRLAVASDVANRAFVGMGGSLGRIGSTFTGVAGVASGLTAGFLALGAAATVGAVAIAKAGDTATATLARLSSATGGLGQAQAVYERLFALSQQTGVAVAESAGSFARFSVAAKEVGATSDQVLKLVSGIQKAGIVAGASAQETGAAVQQLGQALASGTLQGDELRSLLENMPQLAQALARELGVGLGELRKMGSEGQLTAEKVFPALLRASEKMGEEFSRMPVTMGRAKDILIAATEDFGARLDRITGLSQTFARYMQAGASALGAAGRLIAPNEREAADQGVVAAQRRQQQVAAQVAAERAASAYGDVSPGLRQAMEIADQELREALARQQDIRRQDRESQRAEAEDAARQASESRRTRLSSEVRDVAEAADKRLKIQRETAEKLRKIDEAEAAGVSVLQGSPGVPGARFDAAAARAGVLREQAEALKKLAEEEGKAGVEAAKSAEKRQDVIDKLNLQVRAAEEALAGTLAGTEASRESAIALETENQIRAAGIPDIDKRTEAEKRAAEAIGASVRKLDDLKKANKEAEEAAKRAKDFTERSWNAVVAIGERAFDRVGDAIVDAFTRGEASAVSFATVARGIAVSVVSDFAKLALINPALNSLFVGSRGPRETLSGAFGGSGGIGDLLGVGQLFGGRSILDSIGLTGSGGLLSTPLWAGPAVAIEPSIAMGAAGYMAPSSVTLGGVLGGAGAGFGAGMLLNNLLGGNQTGGMVGSGVGALGGAIIGSLIPGVGTLIGGLIGGAAGGGLGGLFGPGESVRGYGLRFQSTAYNEAVGGTNDFGTALKPISYEYYNEEGKAAFMAAEQQVAATNEYLNTRNLRVAGASVIGGNKNGPDYSWADAGTIGEGFSRLRFAAMDNTNLDEQLRQRNFQGVEGLQQFVESFIRIQDTIKGLTTDAIPAFTAQMQAVNDNFDAVTKSAQQYGVAETGLTEARAKAIAALEAQRTETLRQSDVSLSIRRLAAGGDTQQAELVRQAEAARQELEAFGKSLDALALTAADKAARLVALEEVQAAERAAIIERYGEQAAQALRQAGSTIRAYLDNLATGTAAGASPTDRLAAAQANFERDRLLATGGDRDALGRITGSADALLGAGRDMFASGSGFQAILQQVTGGLSNLPVVQSYDAQQTAALQAIQQALTTGTLNTATVILPAGNVVQLAGGAFSAASAADIAATAQATANTVGTLVSGFGQSIAATATGLAAVNQSLGAVNTSVVDLNRSLATIHGSIVAGFGGLGAAQATTAGLTAAVNDNVLATGRAQQEGQAVANALLGAIPAQVLASGAATLAGLAGINQSLAALHSAMADLNTSIATVHGSLVAGLGVLANGAAALAAGQDITARAVVAAGAALQEGQAVGNAGLSILAGGLAVMNGSVLSLGGALATIDATGRDVNTSLATIHGAAVDLNTSLATIHGSIVVGLGALAGGISIAAQQAAATNASVITAGAAIQSGQAVANAIEVGNAAAFATYYGIMTTYLAIIAANTAPVGVPTPVPAPGYTYGGGRGGTNDNLGGILTGATYGGGINGGPGSVENVLTGYTAQVLNGGTRPTQPDSLGIGGGVVAPMLAELQAINGRLVAVEGVLRQVGVTVAQETRASGVLVAGALDEQTTVIRRTAA
jgi:tape measure domain-containing protein